MAIKVRRIDLSPAEWISGTQGMTLEEEGLYMRIIVRMYDRDGEVPADPAELAHLCNVRPQTIRRLLSKLPKFDETGGKLRQNRVETELKLARNRIETARFNGAKGNAAKLLAKAAANPSGDANYQLSTKKGKKESSEAGASDGASAASPAAVAVAQPPPVGNPIRELWDRGTAMLGPQQSARNLIGKMRREHGDLAVIDALGACEAACPSNPAAYLVACLREKGNAHGHKLSARENLWLGFAQAAGDCGTDWPPVATLLDRQ